MSEAYNSKHPLRSLYRMFGASLWWHLGMLVLMTVKNSPVMLAPVSLAAFVYILEQPTPQQWQLWAWFGFYGVMWLQNIPSHMLFVRLLSARLRGFECKLRGRLVDRIQQLSISYFTEKESGALQAKILRDVDNIEQFCQMVAHQGMNIIIMLIVITVVTAIKLPVLLLFMVVSLAICVLMVSVFKRRIQHRNQAFRQRLEGMNSRVNEMVNMISVTRAHGVEAEETEQVNIRFGEVREHGVKLDTINALFGASSTCTIFMTQGACLLITGLLAFHGIISISEVVLFQGMFAQLVNAVMGIIHFYPNLAKGMESLRSLGDVLECPRIEENEGKPAFPGIHGQIRFDNVSFKYPNKDVNAVDEISFEVEAGQCAAFVGSSGSGKSTLMNLLIGFWTPNQGHIQVDGLNLSDRDLRSYRRQIAVVPQHTVLFSGTIRDNITYGLSSVDEAHLHNSIEAANLSEFLSKLPHGLQTHVGENGLQLSGGQRQRLAIARAIIRNPRIIILDEATSALDVESEALVQEAINRLIVGRTTFIVAHRLSTIRRANLIFVMKEGRIIESGTHQQLTASDTHFQRMKALQY